MSKRGGKNREGQRSRVGLLASTLFTATILIMAGLSAEAVAAEPVSIVGLDLQSPNGDASKVKLIVKTSNGESLPPEKLQFKTKNKVVRITFVGVPLSKELGSEVPFAVDKIARVDKGYALPDGETQSFVRLRFDSEVERALDSSKIEEIPGGFALVIPFGTEAAGLEAPTPPAVDDAVAEGLGEEPPVEKSPPAEAPPELGAAPVDPPAAPAKKQGTPFTADIEKKSATPLKLSEKERGPSMGKVALSLAIIIFLIVGLGLGYKKLQSLKLNGAWAMNTKNAVNILSTHRVGKGTQILVVDIFDEVVVLGQGQTGLSFLYKLSEAKANALRGGEVSPSGERPETDIHKALKGFLGRGQRPDLFHAEPQRQDEVLSESLETLAATIEAQHLGPMAPGSVEINTGAANTSFDSFLERRIGKDRWRGDDSANGVPTAKTASKLARAAQAAQLGRSPEPAAPHFNGGDDLDDMARSIRDRARALGRL